MKCFSFLCCSAKSTNNRNYLKFNKILEKLHPQLMSVVEKDSLHLYMVYVHRNNIHITRILSYHTSEPQDHYLYLCGLLHRIFNIHSFFSPYFRVFCFCSFLHLFLECAFWDCYKLSRLWFGFESIFFNFSWREACGRILIKIQKAKLL